MVKYVIFGTVIFITLLMWACCIAAGEADDREERWFDGRPDK